MPEGNTIRYWKISPGGRARLWDECRNNNLICIGWCHNTDWRKTKFGDLTRNPNKESIKKVLRVEYPVKVLFNWGNVPGSDAHKLLSFLKKSQFEQYWDKTEYEDLSATAITKILGEIKVPKDITNKKIADEFFNAVKGMDIGLDDYAQIKKTNDKTIHVSYGDNSVEITLDGNRKKAVPKINNKQIDKLSVKEENGNFNIYLYTENKISRWAEIIKDFFDIKPGHKVIVYDKDFHINALADVIGEYEFNKKIEYPHTKAVKWIKLSDPPLNVKPLEDELETKISLNRTVIEITKKDWDTIYNYANGVSKITVSPPIDFVHPTKELIEKALDELGKTKVSKNELIPKLKEIAGRDGGVLVSDEKAWNEIQKLSEEKYK